MVNATRVRELEGLLKEASDAYYNSDSSVMSDAEFDALRDELEQLDPSNAFLSQVGAPVNGSWRQLLHEGNCCCCNKRVGGCVLGRVGIHGLPALLDEEN